MLRFFLLDCVLRASVAPEGFALDSSPTATVKSIDPDAFMDQAASDHVLALRVLHAGSVIMTHAVEEMAFCLPWIQYSVDHNG
jgi:hypothetical protein